MWIATFGCSGKQSRYNRFVPLHRGEWNPAEPWFRRMNVTQRSEQQVISQKSRTRPGPREAVFTIGDLAKEFAISLRTLRFYEDRGLITPYRDGTARFYTEQDKARLALIMKGKHLGFTLGEIRDLLKNQKSVQIDPQGLALDPEQIATQISHLERQRGEIEGAIRELRAAHARLSQQA